MSTSTDLLYYVYAYLRKSDLTPYYIGKGSGNRAYDKHRNNIRPKDKSRIVFVETNLTEIGSLAIERRMIRWYGRKDLGTGILRNLTDGGDMPPLRKGSIMSSETKIKMSLASTGRLHSSETKIQLSVDKKGENNPMYGKHHSDETKAKVSSALKGIPKSDEMRARVSASKKGKPCSEETKEKIRAAFLARKSTILPCELRVFL